MAEIDLSTKHRSYSVYAALSRTASTSGTVNESSATARHTLFTNFIQHDLTTSD
jgi:hypothetical protein